MLACYKAKVWTPAAAAAQSSHPAQSRSCVCLQTVRPQRRHKILPDKPYPPNSVAFEAPIHLDPLLSAGLGTYVPVLIALVSFILFFSKKCRFVRVSARIALFKGWFRELKCPFLDKQEATKTRR